VSQLVGHEPIAGIYDLLILPSLFSLLPHYISSLSQHILHLIILLFELKLQKGGRGNDDSGNEESG
jgi:hypothetical protein